MSQDIGKNVVSLLGGIGVGALAMYLFDPELGQRRRSQLSEKAGDVAGTTSQNVSSAFDKLTSTGAYDKASTGMKMLGKVGSSVLKRASDVGEQAGDLGRRPIGRRRSKGFRRAMSKFGSNLRDRVSDMTSSASETGGQLSSKVRGSRALSVWSEVALVTGCVALGMGVMYMFDPIAGRRRRSLVRDKVRSGFNQIGDSLDKTGRHLWNRTSGTVSELRGRLHEQPVTDDVLVQRVRSQIGRCVSNPGALNIQADHGCITVSGPVLAEDVDNILKCVWNTRGVKELINRLDIHQQAGREPSLQGM